MSPRPNLHIPARVRHHLTPPKELILHWMLLRSNTEAVLGQGKTNFAHCSANKHPSCAL